MKDYPSSLLDMIEKYGLTVGTVSVMVEWGSSSFGEKYDQVIRISLVDDTLRPYPILNYRGAGLWGISASDIRSMTREMHDIPKAIKYIKKNYPHLDSDLYNALVGKV